MDKQAKAAAQRLVAAWYDMSKHMDDATFKAGMDDGKTLYEYVLKEGRFTGRPSASQASYHAALAAGVAAQSDKPRPATADGRAADDGA